MSKKLTEYVVKTGIVPVESYEIYQYGFQIGLEMLFSFVVCFGVATYLHMIPEFVVYTGIFMLLRTYAGGVHLNSFRACFTCSIIVQTVTLLIILASAIFIVKVAPVESINRELDSDEKIHCKKVTMRILFGIILFTGCCTVGGMSNTVSLIALTVLVILISQYVGIVKFKIEKSKNER